MKMKMNEKLVRNIPARGIQDEKDSRWYKVENRR